MDASLKDFLRTGCIGAVGLGASEADVLARLGTPADPGADSWTYGDLQITFEEGAVCSLVLVPTGGQAPDGGSAVELDPWVIEARLSVEVARAALTAAGIGFEDDDDPQNPGVRLLVTDGNVALIFSVDPEVTTLPAGLFMVVCTRS